MSAHALSPTQERVDRCRRRRAPRNRLPRRLQDRRLRSTRRPKPPLPRDREGVVASGAECCGVGGPEGGAGGGCEGRDADDTCRRVPEWERGRERTYRGFERITGAVD